MGAKSTPTYLKLLRGNPGKRAINKKEPKPVGNLTAAPDWMSAGQKAGWDYAITHSPAGMLKLIDRSILAVWVVAENTHREATEKMNKFGLLAKTPNTGQIIQSPYLPIVNRQAQIMMKAACELGFSPTARVRLIIDPTPEKNEFDDI
jgi:P27 family predicted phage terminase small subunit